MKDSVACNDCLLFQSKLNFFVSEVSFEKYLKLMGFTSVFEKNYIVYYTLSEIKFSQYCVRKFNFNKSFVMILVNQYNY